MLADVNVYLANSTFIEMHAYVYLLCLCFGHFFIVEEHLDKDSVTIDVITSELLTPTWSTSQHNDQ